MILLSYPGMSDILLTPNYAARVSGSVPKRRPRCAAVERDLTLELVKRYSDAYYARILRLRPVTRAESNDSDARKKLSRAFGGWKKLGELVTRAIARQKKWVTCSLAGLEGATGCRGERHPHLGVQKPPPSRARSEEYEERDEACRANLKKYEKLTGRHAPGWPPFPTLMRGSSGFQAPNPFIRGS